MTCRFVSILIASILKSKGIPCRVRSGHASYFDFGSEGNISSDHWINQYWSQKEKRWITIDVDGSLSLKDAFDPYDIPYGKFDFPADSWLQIRNKEIDANRFHNAKPEKGAIVVLWALFHDFHSLMNNEIPYYYGPACGFGAYEKFERLKKEELKRIDNLAKLIRDPDQNFERLKTIWNNEWDFRLLGGGLL